MRHCENVLCWPEVKTKPLIRSRHSVRPEERRFHCNRCSKSYMRNAHLHRHQKYECGKEPQFQCPFCNKRCKIKSNLTQHIITHFPKDDRYKFKK